MRLLLAALASAILLWFLNDANHEPPLEQQTEKQTILVSIHPIGLIVSALIDGVDNVTTHVLLPNGASPHTYALKPSDMQQIQRSNLAIWVGPGLEHFLAKPLQTKRDVMTLQEIENLPLRAYKETHHEHEHEHEHDHAHTDVDLHVWLGVPQVKVIAEQIAQRLYMMFPMHQQQLQANYQRFIKNLTEKDAHCAQRLAKLRDKGYFVFHDAYGYWQDHYNLPALGHFTVSPERQPGAKRLESIRQKLQDGRAQCIFSEPQFEPAVINAIAKGTGARIVPLDPLGGDIALGAEGYIDFLDDLTSRFEQCLLP